MTSVFLKELQRYSQADLVKKFRRSEKETVSLLRRLKQYGVLKIIKVADNQKNLDDLVNEESEVADIEVGDTAFYYVFTFVGVILAENLLLKCYPKYIKNTLEPHTELKQIIKVLEKYSSKEQEIKLYDEMDETHSFNKLAVMFFLLIDYFENGSYTNMESIIELNGTGEILWDRTINDSTALLSDNRPFYLDLKTRRSKNDEQDYIKRLHECVITKCSKEMREAGLLDLFDLTEAEISDERLEDFGNTEFILERISKELNVQFNTRKQLLLKTLRAYIANEDITENSEYICLYGTNSFNLVWESVCSEILNNQLQVPIGKIQLPGPLAAEYQEKKSRKLIELIDKPEWSGHNSQGQEFIKQAKDTLIPDLVTIVKNRGEYQFIIFDAKYYNLQLEQDLELRGQPGIESISKQYAYQLAFQPFLEKNNIQTVRNCFLLPTEEDEIIVKGKASLSIYQALGLEDIQIRLLPAALAFKLYIENKRLDISKLAL